MFDFAARLRIISAYTSDRWLWAWALGYAAIGAASLLVPLYALALGGGPLIAGVLEATAGLAGVPGALLWGRLADRTGQRRVFVLGGLLAGQFGYQIAFAVAGGGVLVSLLVLLASALPFATGTPTEGASSEDS